MAKYAPKSHPGKLLVTHKKGVLSHCEINDLTLLVVVFHDVGKMNDNFQKKIVGLPFEGYSNHSYISAYYLINAFANNQKAIIKRFPFINKDNYNLILLILANIIAGHHGSLKNIDELFSKKIGKNGMKYDEWGDMVEYLKTIKMTNHVRTFFRNNPDLLNCKLRFTDDIQNSDYYKSFGRIDDVEKWSDNALDYYYDTVVTYGELVHGDRRDASGNVLCYRNKSKKKYAYSLENNLETTYRSFKAKTELNKIRNQIRELAINTLRAYLKEGKYRVFALTAPTSCGKTFMMLQLAVEIMKKFDYDYDIIYGLPYLSIIDQTIKIINNELKLETLNHTSASDISDILQKMMEENADSKQMIELAFSENCFDHPLIITTFNQIFESLINRATTKLMRLKNFKKRIFLIDEFQATDPAQYYTLVQLLNKFCERYDCYVIISTATMPNFNIDLDKVANKDVKRLFKNSVLPKELLIPDIFNYSVFNRYIINFMGEVNADSLYEMVNKSTVSTLLIVNTIRTSQRMHAMFANDNSNFEKINLLNAHISPHDRLQIIDEVKRDLEDGTKILLVSTQVIEAGVDISFPVLYRDAAPPSSIVQSNGRGNRNGEFGVINSYLFLYKDPEMTTYDCNMVYRGAISKKLTKDIKDRIPPATEREFHKRCQFYFYNLSEYVVQGRVNDEQNLIEDILCGKFYELGKYRFIQGDPDAITIYVGNNGKDWNDYSRLFNEMQVATGYQDRDLKQVEFKKIRGTILQNSINIRQKVLDTLRIDENGVFGIFRLLDNNRYNSRTGLIEL